MFYPRIIFRLIHINWVLVSHGLDEIVFKTHLFRPVRYFAVFSPSYWLKPKTEPRAVRIRLALEELGPIYVKFGQALSTRKDLLRFARRDPMRASSPTRMMPKVRCSRVWRS